MPDLLTSDETVRNEELHRFAHDLKNRLGSLWQAAKLLHELPPGPEHAELLELAEKSYFSGARQVEDLLDDFGVPRGIEHPEIESVSLLPILERSIKSMGFRTTPKHQRFTLNVPQDLHVLADPRLLAQIVEALLSNASKFSAEGAGISISAGSVDGMVLLSVQDPGVGLSIQDLDAIFTRYVMLSSRSTGGESQARSTLARAKQWAELQGGSLNAQSAGIGHGSLFTLALRSA
ncbi:MAG: sensor histidine kinase [Flavobacteriales bacterium]